MATNPRIKRAIVFGRNPHQPDSFDTEAEAAEVLGVETFQLDLHALLEGNPDRALAAIPERGHLRLLYRIDPRELFAALLGVER